MKSGQQLDAEAFLAEAARSGTTGLVANAPARLTAVEVGSHLMPATVTEPDPARALSWVVSLRSAYGPYALHELGTLPFPPVRPPLAAVVKAIDLAMVKAGLDRLVCINNWLLSTNLYPDWRGEALAEVTGRLTSDYPGHFIAFRSLNSRHHRTLLQAFTKAGWSLLPSRQVWIAEPGIAPNRDRNNDARLLARTRLVRVHGDAFDDRDWDRAAELYAQLYLGKYSPLNPVFTPRFLAWAHGCRFMRVEGLRGEDGHLMAIVGTIAANGVMTTPLIGYEMTAPRKLGLYRMATAMAFEDMERRGASFNLSAGVGPFKRNRGALPAVEYTALWCRHLPPARRLPIMVLRGILTGLGVPLMEKYAL